MGAEFFDKVSSDKRPEDLSYNEITTILRKIYEPGENIFSVRMSFRGLRRDPGESLEDFEVWLRTAVLYFLIKSHRFFSGY